MRERLGNFVADKLGGFFVRYAYARSLMPPQQPYAAIERLCEASPFRSFVEEMASHLDELRGFGDDPEDPIWDRRLFPPLDGVAAFTAVRKFRPRRIIEIGSGSSTRYLARAAHDLGTDILCIDPSPQASLDGLGVRHEQRLLREDDHELCAALEPGDIFFIDSSHIQFPGMDVDIEFNRCFPALRPGVIVHLHDIFLPFDYPPEWSSRRYNEQTALVGWLFGAFEIIYPGYYVLRRHEELLDRNLGGFPPLRMRDAGSLWLRKL